MVKEKVSIKSHHTKLNSVCVSDIKPYVDKAIPFIAGAAVIVDKVISRVQYVVDKSHNFFLKKPQFLLLP